MACVSQPVKAKVHSSIVQYITEATQRCVTVTKQSRSPVV